MTSILIVFLIIIIVGPIIAVLTYKNKEEMKEHNRKEFEKQREKLKIEENRIAEIQQALIDKYGQPTKIININAWKTYDPKKYIIVFAEQSIVYLDGQEMAFEDISSFKIIDNYEIKHGEVYGELDTDTDDDSLIGRSIGGAVLGGAVGAIIGASTASKNTTAYYSQENDQLIHNYILIAGTKSFSKPTIQIRIGDNWKLASEIEVIFNLILEKNK